MAESVHTAPSTAADALVQLAGMVHGIFARVAERHGLTPAQARLLCLVADRPSGMAELARCSGVEKAALTGLVDRVERRGLVERSTVPGDRRVVQVAPTDAGRQAATAFHADVEVELNRLVEPLGPREREQFPSAVAQIAAACGDGRGHAAR